MLIMIIQHACVKTRIFFTNTTITDPRHMRSLCTPLQHIADDTAVFSLSFLQREAALAPILNSVPHTHLFILFILAVRAIDRLRALELLGDVPSVVGPWTC